MTIMIPSPPGIQDLKLAAKATLGVANAVITATIPAGYKYLRVVFYGVTTGDPGATAPIMTINGVVTNYFSRALQVYTTTIANVTATTGVPVMNGSAFGAACRIAGTLDIMCPTSGKKVIVGIMNGNEAGTETTYDTMIVSAESDDTAEVTSITFTLAASTWTTATEIRVYGGEN